MKIDFNPERLISPEIRAQYGYVLAIEICEQFGYTIGTFDGMVRAGRIPKPCYTVGCRKMRVWHKDKLASMPTREEIRKKKEVNRELTPCIQIDAATAKLLRDTRRLFAVMGNMAG